MEQGIRNTLQRATQQIRRLLEEEFAEQLEGTFDILASGKILPSAGKHLDARQRLTRQKLVDAIEHIKAGGKKPHEAVEEYTREAAFTFLNRFVALRMLEARGLLQECVSKGDQSSGFKEFTGLAPGLASMPDGGYRLYLECLFDELSVEVKVLFDRRDSASLSWPRRGALTELLDILGQTDLACVWGEDETIGWVYQYFNSGEERKKMRDESQAPRNSRELAVRNQFFTPRYVVEFLTDNTLGRIWYEMRKGTTRLVDECRYLVRRPSEVFLDEGQEPPTADDNSDQDLSQEELLKKTVYIPHRAKKDPRDLKILDPACGSGHFLLYAFDLLLSIYDEAWHDDAGPKSEVTGKRLSEDYPELQQLHAALPGLVLAHNLHGIDIDPRAAQIAALALWMRGQRAFNEFGISRTIRTAIAKSNIVCAEPMPGEAGFLDDFIKEHLSESAEGRFLASLVRKVFESMKLAGEAGSLLKVEEDIAEEVANAKKQWLQRPAMKQKTLFADGPQVHKKESDLARGITDASFWEEAEQRIYDALRAYSEHAEQSGGFQKRLFAIDAARGFAFIDICNFRYDAVLMNPPFGQIELSSRDYVEAKFPACGHNIYPAFVERGLSLLNANCFVGAITHRTGLLLARFHEWRRKCLLSEGVINTTVDLGHGVLDDAMVEAAAYCVRKSTLGEVSKNVEAVFFSALHIPNADRSSHLVSSIARFRNGIRSERTTYLRFLKEFQQIPTHPLAYSFPGTMAELYQRLPALESDGRVVRSTNQTSDDFRFARLRWEVPENSDRHWAPFAKGGNYAPYYVGLHLVIDWSELYGTYRGYTGTKHRPDIVPASAEYFFNPGVTYSRRTNSALSPRVLAAGSVFGNIGPAVLCQNSERAAATLGIMMSRVFQAFVELRAGAGDSTSSGTPSRTYDVGILQSVPFPDLCPDDEKQIADLTRQIIEILRHLESSQETSPAFRRFMLVAPRNITLAELSKTEGNAMLAFLQDALRKTHAIEAIVKDAYGIIDSTYDELCDIVGKHPLDYPPIGDDEHSVLRTVGRLSQLSLSQVIRDDVEQNGGRRCVTVQTYYVCRDLEVLAHVVRRSAESVASLIRDELANRLMSPATIAARALSYFIGCAFGRWKFDVSTPLSPVTLDPFDESANVAQSVCNSCIDILVGDPGHRLDIGAAVRRYIQDTWQECDVMVMEEFATALSFSDGGLSEYLSRHFFNEHQSQYSMSQRNAPIYWQLATNSASYSTWLFYHRFTKDTFFKLLNEYVKPKLEHELQKLERARSESGAAPTMSQRKEIEDQEIFVSELGSMGEEVERVAPLWNPNLNDGVIINFAPLWRLVPQNKTWQKECKECWDKLVAGDYDWAHLTMHLWPERVVPKCVDDASLAIAHGLEGVFWQQDDKGRFQPKAKPEGGWQSVIDRLVKERISPAVKAALKSLLEAPVSSSGSTKSRRRKGSGA